MAGGVRARRKLEAMRRIQQVALDLFEPQGFQGVTVATIAERSDVSAMTVYRYFGTKEGIVLWDEYDPPILEEIQRRLGTDSIIAAIRDGLVAVADEMLDEELDLRRLRLVYADPDLRAAAEASSRMFAAALAALLRADPLRLTRFDADAVAGSVAGLMIAAIDEWQRSETRMPLREILRRAFDVLEVAIGT